jgi:hypothetical protein
MVVDDFSKLGPTAHMLQWLDDSPLGAIRSKIESILQEQVSGSQLIAIQVSSDPQWLTGARPSNGDPDKAILVRTGVAFEFRLSVQEPNGPVHHLQGVFSWVGIHLDDSEKAQQRIWFDIGGNLETLGSEGELRMRMYFA